MRNYRPQQRGFSYKPRSVKRLEGKMKRNLIITAVVVIFLLYFFVTSGLPIIVGGLSSFNKKTVSKEPANAIEDAAVTPPFLNIPFEATNSASLKINGYSEPNTQIEIYLDDELKSTVTTDSGGNFSSDSITLTDGINYIYGKTIESSKKSLPSKRIKVIYSSEKPKLEISEPTDNKEIKGGDKKVHIAGKTDPNNIVTINGASVIVNSEGSFASDLTINDGDNNIVFIAQNQVGNTTKIERKVKYTP